MKKVLIGVWLSTVAALAWASCTTHTYFVNGKMVMCTTCCYGSNCTTNCF
jgi:hypothetical protein